MPNHVTALCTVTGPIMDIVVFIGAHVRLEKNERTGKMGEVFDFETIVPMPQCVKDTIHPMPWDEAVPGVPASPGDYDVMLAARSMMADRHDTLMPGDIYSTHLERLGHPKTWADIRRFFEANIPGAIFWGQRALRCAAETGTPGWYPWSCLNWGTKWNSYSYAMRESAEGSFAFKFETAWSFPEPIFRKLAAMYPSLVFAIEAYDEGSNFACTGQFNGADDYRTIKATDEMYERVYGHPPDSGEDEESPLEDASAR